MLKTLICGAGSFHEVDDHPSTPSTTAWKSNSKNPYSSRGRDEFAALLADLDDRRQRIYKEMGLQDNDSLVRFGYSQGHWIPIVVKLKDHHEAKKSVDQGQGQGQGTEADSEGLHDSDAKQVAADDDEVEGRKTDVDHEKNKRKNLSSVILARWRRKDYYLCLVIILILLCLVTYGRSFAILCTSIGWYLVPNMNQDEVNLVRLMRRKKKKDNYMMRKLSEKNMDRHGHTTPKTTNLHHGSPPRH